MLNLSGPPKMSVILGAFLLPKKKRKGNEPCLQRIIVLPVGRMEHYPQTPPTHTGAGRERHTEVTLQLHHPVVSDASYACFSCFRKLPRPAALVAWTSSLHQLAVCGI